jgi:hypothetical protein
MKTRSRKNFSKSDAGLPKLGGKDIDRIAGDPHR